ncbi:MAG: hypothetical protein ACXWZB_05440 [Gaiellaceae bacterium]
MLRFALGAALLSLAVGCGGGTRTVGEGDPDLDQVRAFARHPLYWAGERFEQWELESVDVENPRFASFRYGTCELDDPDGFGPEGGSCSLPISIQIQPLCAHLSAVARNPIWKRRYVRGSPVGSIDGAPVLFTNRVQVKVYRGQGTDPGVELRVLRQLRSANAVEPVVAAHEPIPRAPRGVLERGRCS